MSIDLEKTPQKKLEVLRRIRHMESPRSFDIWSAVRSTVLQITGGFRVFHPYALAFYHFSNIIEICCPQNSQTRLIQYNLSHELHPEQLKGALGGVKACTERIKPPSIDFPASIQKLQRSETHTAATNVSHRHELPNWPPHCPPLP